VVDDAAALAVAALAEGEALDTPPLGVRAVDVDVPICAGVEVDETTGGAFWIYEPSACTA